MNRRLFAANWVCRVFMVMCITNSILCRLLWFGVWCCWKKIIRCSDKNNIHITHEHPQSTNTSVCATRINMVDERMYIYMYVHGASYVWDDFYVCMLTLFFRFAIHSLVLAVRESFYAWLWIRWLLLSKYTQYVCSCINLHTASSYEIIY